jgi:hypothetical protein
VSAPFPPEPDRDVLESSPRWGRAASLLQRVPRWLTLTVAALLLAGAGAVLAISHGGHSGRHSGSSVRTVSFPAACDPFADWRSSRVGNGMRVVLGDVAVPPAYLPPAQRVGLPRPPVANRPWRYGWKTEVAYRGGRPPVTISVPAGWQRRVSLFGGASGTAAAASTLRIPSCPPRGAWNNFAWIFYLSQPTACVPLQVQVPGRTATVWFGFGTRCPADASASTATNTGPDPTAMGSVLLPPGCGQSGDRTTAQDRRGFRILVGGGTEQLGLGARCPAAVSGRSAARR